MDLGSCWVEAMREYDFLRAWKINDAVLREKRRTGEPKHAGERHLQSIWRGEAFMDARVFVRCYHGLGDTLQFLRFARPLRALAKEVTIWSQPELEGLISRVGGIDRVLSLHDGTPEAEFDVDLEIMELGYALRVNKDDVAKYVPYIRAHPDSGCLRERALQVGLIWQGGNWDVRRSVPSALLERVAMIDGVICYSLNPDVRPETLFCQDLSSRSVETLASRMAALDLVITVDTMAAHLAGAMGLRTWTLLPANADWRWGKGRQSVWYPTMTLFRQTVEGKWGAPLLEIKEALHSLVRERT
jgi:hypothetical protein